MKTKIFCLGVCTLFLVTNSLGYVVAESGQRVKLEAAWKEKREKLQVKKLQITKLEQEISSYDGKMAENMKLLKENQRILTTQKQYFKKIMVRIYKKYDVDLFAQLITSGSLSQFLSRLQIIGLILREERNALTKYNNATMKVAESIKRMTEAKNQQNPLLEKASKEVSFIEKESQDVLSRLQKLDEEEGVVTYYKGSYGGSFCFPCAGGRLKQRNDFWEWRGNYHHQGVDIMAPMGRPIYAANAGVVEMIKANPGGYGMFIDIGHGGGVSTRYAHMYRTTILVHQGQHVEKGQQIARVGMNGDTTAPHLHFEVRKNNRPINPVPFLR